jgi:hypothetical protein
LFRFSLPVRRREPLWTNRGAELDESYRLLDLGALDSRPGFGDVRMAWSKQGLAFRVRVAGRTLPLCCRESYPAESDGLQVWIDTRATLNVHRATRFCHQLVFLPAGGGHDRNEPLVRQHWIARAKEDARRIAVRNIAIVSRIFSDGYELHAAIPATGLTGFDPMEHSHLGFHYALFDREFGLQTLSVGSDMPYESNPTTWARLELSGEG